MKIRKDIESIMVNIRLSYEQNQESFFLDKSFLPIRTIIIKVVTDCKKKRKKDLLVQVPVVKYDLKNFQGRSVLRLFSTKINFIVSESTFSQSTTPLCALT